MRTTRCRTSCPGSGQPGRCLVNGVAFSEFRKMTMHPNDVIVLETPGGGGYGKAE
jgi:N-methylhydantoinase B